MQTASHWIPVLIALVAFLYSMVGHGGASGVIAVLSLASLPSRQVGAAALVLNLVVATLALAAFARARHFRWRLTWPFVLGSVPCAFAGAACGLSDHTYFLLVGVMLVAAGLQLIVSRGPARGDTRIQAPRVPVSVAVGSGIGVLSGMVGVGGGIFLSPVMVLRRWANARQASATAAAFIVANSAAGLIGRAQAGVALPPGFWWMVACGTGGALAGGHVGARWMPMAGLRRVLGGVLLLAAVKMLTR